MAILKNATYAVLENSSGSASKQSSSSDIRQYDLSYISSTLSMMDTTVDVANIIQEKTDGLSRSDISNAIKRSVHYGALNTSKIGETRVPKTEKHTDVNNPNSVEYKILTNTNNDKATVSIHTFSYSDDLKKIIDNLHDTLNIQLNQEGVNATFDKMMGKYNRFKVPTPNSVLTQAHSHLFFSRPDCNLFKTRDSLINMIASHPTFSFINKCSPNLLKELQASQSGDNKLLLSLSNAVETFDLKNEELTHESYGTTFGGYKIDYGKHTVESNSAGNFSCTFRDDRNAHIYQIIKAWIDYISGCYRGSLSPKELTIIKKILDYASSCYYIVTAEDDETIIFWSKYYGIYPIVAPNSQFNMQQGKLISVEDNKLNVDFAYSFKRDFSADLFTEFNSITGIGKKMEEKNDGQIPGNVSKIYDPYTMVYGNTWVSTPFIVADIPDKNSGSSKNISFKLKYLT